jgi:hypothetical protein
MDGSRVPDLKIFFRAMVAGVAALIMVAVARPVTAQVHCAVYEDILLDTSDTCVNEPWRERAFGVQQFIWNGKNFIMMNRGNELSIHNIDNPTAPLHLDTSEFRFGTRGDSDYDLLDFDVCDECRYGILSHKVKGTVIFDMGAGGNPVLYPDGVGYWNTTPGDTFAGGYTFQRSGTQYVVMSAYPEDCGTFGTGVYALNGLEQPGLAQCVEIDGAPVFVRGMYDYEVGGALYLYLSDGAGQAHVFRVDGGGLSLSLTHLSSPPGMKAGPYAFSIDTNNARAASGRSDRDGGEVTIWDLSNPGSPQIERTIPVAADMVSLSSPGVGNDATLFIADRGDFGSERAYMIDDGPPTEFAEGYWSDRDLPHNQLPGCGVPMSSALSPDGTVLYLSRTAIHQVFDLVNCLSPVEATADLTVAPESVYPGGTVTVTDTSYGKIDRWALWITEEPGGTVVAGSSVPSAANPHEINFQVPQNLTSGTNYQAHVVVESNDLPPAVPAKNRWIAIDRAPTVEVSVDPEAVIVGESVDLLATVGGGTPASYEWEIRAPDATTQVRSGAAVPSLPLPIAGTWTFQVTAAYAHEASAGVLYQATDTRSFSVTSVAADFTIVPSNPLHTQVITLDGSYSKPAGGDLSYFWEVDSNLHSYNGCGDVTQCVIPAESLLPDTTYTVKLTVTNNADQATSTMSRAFFVGNGNINPTINFSPPNPEIGETVVYTISGVPGDLSSASWNMGGPGCDGADSTPTCTPNLWHDCKTLSYKYSTSGAKPVSLSVVIDGNTFPAGSKTVQVASSGSCGTVVVPPDPCSYSLSRTSMSIGPGGGEGSFQVSTTYSCSWTVRSNAGWIKIESPTGGSANGAGTVRFQVQENTGVSRTGSISVAGKTFVVYQGAPWRAANFTISKPFPNIGEAIRFTVDPLLDVKSWNFGEPNCAGQSPTIDCTYLPSGSCNEVEWAFPTSGEKSVTMVLSDGRTQTKHPVVKTVGECCYADGRPDASFVMSQASGYTGDVVFFSDTSSDTTGKALKALGFTWTPSYPEIGQNITFSLDGVTATITKATWDFGDTGCDGLAAVQECVPDLWNDCTAKSFTYATGGEKQVSVSLELQGGATQTAGPLTIDVANSGSCEGGGGGCSYTLSPTAESFSFEGGAGSFDVNTTADCEWQATTTNPWLTISSGTGVGPGSVGYTVDANTGTATRSGTIAVEGRLFRVTQTGDKGDTAPTEWRWTVTRVENEEGETVYEEVYTSLAQHTSFRFEMVGLYQVTLVAGNCFGQDTTLQYIRIEEAPIEDFVVGAAVSVAGANDTHWESDFRFYNPCAGDLAVRIEYQPENTNNYGAELVFREFQLVPNETRVFSHITEAIPGLGEPPVSGSVKIVSQSNSGCKVLSVSRTFNDTPDGSLGLFVPALPVKRVGREFLDLNGLISTNEYRTNLRLVSYEDEDVWVPLTAFDRNGNLVGQRREVKVRAQSTKQINEVAEWLGVTDNLTAFSVRAEVDGLDVQAFGTVVDNLTGDSVLYLSSFHGEERIWLVGVASLSGVNNSQWRTDLWLYNPTSDWLSGEVEFVVGDNPSDSYGFRWPTLGEHRTKQYLDIVSNELGLEETRGYIVLTGDGGPVPQVAARTYNLDPAGGTYGLNLRAYGSKDLLQVGETGYIAGVSNSADQAIGFRTNVGVLNTDRTGWTTVRITMYGLDGTQAGDSYETTIAPGKLRQFDIFKKVGLGDVTMTGSLMVEAVSGGAIAVYATEIDNRTQDSIFIPAQRPFVGSAQ